MELSKKNIRNIFLGVAGCIFLYWLLHETDRVISVLRRGWDVLLPFIAGAVVAFILNVPMRAFERWLKFIKRPGLRRIVSILLTIVAVLLVLLCVVYLLVPQLVATVESLVETLPDFFYRTQERITEYLNENPELMTWLAENTEFENLNWPDLVQKIVTLVSNSLTAIVDRALSAVVGLSTGIFNAVLSLVFSLYCLSRKEILARQGRRLLYSFLPEKASDETVRILRMTNSTFSNFISGQCVEAVILGAMFAIGMAIFRMPYIPLVSVTIAVLALIPIVGAFIGCGVGAFFIMIDNPVMALWFIVLFLVLQQIEGNMIYPRVVGTSVGLPGMWVLLAVAVGGELMGVGGMLLMIPLVSVLYALAREITSKRLAARQIAAEKLKDQPPELRSHFKEKRKQTKERKLLKKLLEKKKQEKKDDA